MESTSSSENYSFGSTVSSSSPLPHDQSDETKLDTVAIKEEPVGDAPLSSDGYEPSVWAHIFDENGVMQLDVDDNDDPMAEEDVAADPRHATAAASVAAAAGAGGRAAMGLGGTFGDTLFGHAPSPFHEPTPSSVFLEHWHYDDEDMASPSLPHHHRDIAHTFADSGTSPVATMTSAAMDTGCGAARLLPPLSASAFLDSREPAYSGGGGLPFATGPRRPSTASPAQRGHSIDGRTGHPAYVLCFDKHRDGRSLPLSKPLVRDDGLLLVGTDIVSAARDRPLNRIFVADFRSLDDSPAQDFVETAAEVRDLQWLGDSTAVAAIGSDIHLVVLGALGNQADDEEDTDSCSLTPPIRRVHADTIREIAVTPRSFLGAHSIASAGFDETVVLTKLGEGGDTASAVMTGKIDAYDVVSSLRWHPSGATQLSWTTDGGDFQIADVRARTKPQLKVALSQFLDIDRMGGLFSHEYISDSNVVLGFQSSHLLFLDLRMPRKQYCYGVMKAPLECVGELRRSATGDCGMFGVGGFATSTVTPTGRELAFMQGAGPANGSQVSIHAYKTSGDFSRGSGSVLAVADNLGVVSIYDRTHLNRSAASADNASASPPDDHWQERNV